MTLQNYTNVNNEDLEATKPTPRKRCNCCGKFESRRITLYE